jgi:hypothetical protein
MSAGNGLDKKLCQVGGINQNYVSPAGTLYHIQIEDRGPIVDAVLESEVRRVTITVYANYGEPNTRIIHGRDHDYPDVRTHEHNRFIQHAIQALADEARRLVDEKEQTQVLRIKCLIREYHHSKDEAVKREFEEANADYPFVFSRAWLELKQERGRASGPAAAAAGLPAPDLEPEPEVVYPLDAGLRDRVLEIERVIGALGRDLQALRAQGSADDILVQTCRKLVVRAQEGLTGRGELTDFTSRRLEMMRNSLLTTWRQVQSRLKVP